MLFSHKLRLLASYLEERPKLNERYSGHWDYPTVYINAEDAEDFGQLCRMMGKFQKDRTTWNDSISADYTPEADGDAIFSVRVSLAGVCQKVPRLNDDGTPVTRKVTKTVPIETREEVEEVQEYDWKCPDSWLSL